jgi:hypothetical protein
MNRFNQSTHVIINKLLYASSKVWGRYSRIHHYIYYMSTADERLKQFLNEARDWEKKVTNIPGIFLLKLPTFKGTSPSLAIEVNPVNPAGSSTKRRGVIIRSNSELEEISRLLSDPKVAQLAKSIDEVNPSKESTAAKSGGTDVFEI